MQTTKQIQKIWTKIDQHAAPQCHVLLSIYNNTPQHNARWSILISVLSVSSYLIAGILNNSCCGLLKSISSSRTDTNSSPEKYRVMRTIVPCQYSIISQLS